MPETLCAGTPPGPGLLIVGAGPLRGSTDTVLVRWAPPRDDTTHRGLEALGLSLGTLMLYQGEVTWPS